ncbi:uncharacterized mitochondrial protein AtMg00810-like [Benincasa hispida]|uniref:uncharacterized mitochondrial protein AtMg00810-like n=1 Tax=Benincasa hispida TaxID=102211 RepID=UPI001902AFEF|nr:uncharacterized mitochondrial protein AtMg00810-like [Benincasa hispida]
MGYKQQIGIDYNEVFAPIERHDTIRMVLALAAQSNWKILQIDVKSAFLHGNLNEEVYIDQPLGYVQHSNARKVYCLKKALYGLKQARRACLYVDDLIYTGNDSIMFEEFKQFMMAEFEMTDLGMMHYFLGIEVIQSVVRIFINQKKYALEILDRFQMENCNSATTSIEPNLKLTKDHEGKKVNNTLYKQMIGSLMYLTATRPDIMYAVSLISRFMESPTKLHLLVAKRILHYLKGTPGLGILYQKREKLNLVGFSDSDYAGDLNDRNSTSGYVFMLGLGAISWSSKKQPIITLSTIEAELVAATSCACQAIWLRNILENLHYKQEETSIIHCDILTRLSYYKSEDQVVDILTKPLKLATFVKLRSLLRVVSSTTLK